MTDLTAKKHEDDRAFYDRISEAYDWLAKTHTAQAEYAAAQAILQNAVRLSPTIVNRQKTLGEVAHKNKDYDVAEQALRDTISLAKYSFWRDAGNYAQLSKVQLDKGDVDAGHQPRMARNCAAAVARSPSSARGGGRKVTFSSAMARREVMSSRSNTGRTWACA